MLALDLADPHERTPDLAHSHPPASELLWSPHLNHLLSPGDRVVVATTREGLAQLTGGTGQTSAQRPAEGTTP